MQQPFTASKTKTLDTSPEPWSELLRRVLYRGFQSALLKDAYIYIYIYIYEISLDNGSPDLR